jgi:hypothetical protein
MEFILALFVCLVPIALLHSATENFRNYENWQFAWFPFATLIFFLSATRIGGSDWQNYEYLYLYMSYADSWLDAILQNTSFEPGYVVLNYAFHGLSNDRRWLVVFESAINAYAIWLILTRVNGGPIFLIWLFPLQFANILGVRQTLATSLFVIAVTQLHGRLSLIAALSSGIIHVSSLVLVFGKSLERLRLTWRTVGYVFIFGIVIFIVAGDFFSNKLDNYRENADDLTNVSSLEITLGKGLVIFLLIGISEFARRQLQRKQLRAVGYAISMSTIMYFFYFAVIAAAAMLPPLARLLTPLEFLIAWSCCGAIAAVKIPRVRVTLAFVIATVSLAKMLKIWALYGDIYSVCFFCV